MNMTSPVRTADTNATASAALIDVRTGFVYGVAESTATEEQRASVWSTESAIVVAKRSWREIPWWKTGKLH